ncbi:beta-ketoacyl-[acyl-carrier-protein] synthase family protein [Nonlabens xiamenensis]|uniref:beta-ketoacyl-[acyl-carrier-protein] synthase family protein n=1 Tax=Nonlabens xiamenensis TaxID=2341043 RepID=UPI000F60F633|nr:beta-ketoacyl-[acyl-carrier-protein] synthase family protein [Nonlabens xiamenensis]
MDVNEARVVVTGLGVVAPNGVGVPAFAKALTEQTSGIKQDQELADLQFACQVSGTPPLTEDLIAQYFSPLQLRGLHATGLVYGVIAGKEAFADAGLTPAGPDQPLWEIGIVFGTGQSGGHKFREAIHLIDQGKVRRLGSNSVIQTMTSGISAWLAGELGCGNQITSNSSACCTGTEALLMGYERIKAGRASRMIVGATSDSGPYIWGGFDAMRVLVTRYNYTPSQASRPFSNDAAGFAPGSGAGALVLERLDLALERGAHIYAEVKGGALNSGGQRSNGSMTAPNAQAVRACIELALQNAACSPKNIDVVNGHLTATGKDDAEIAAWCAALGRTGKDFPTINSFKSTIGHCLAAAGSIELVGAVLQIDRQFFYGNTNISHLKPEIADLIHPDCVPMKSHSMEINKLIKASFGFGDVNACVVLEKYLNK